ncbi:helix-turn-helix domain-containing protein [Phytoactinopolyspora halophila]|nr:tetratricopeptide repeat protein [Phytoactinopolyspora halophila]
MTEQPLATADEAPEPTPVGQRIRSRRLELGLSQADIAEGMLSPSYVSLVESGRRQPAAAALAHIAERLRIDVEYLRDGVDASVRTRARLALGRAEKALYDGRAADAYDEFTTLVGDPGLNDEQARRARLGQAQALERKGDIEGAIGLLNELAEEARQRPDVQPWLDIALAMSRCYQNAGDLDMAIQVGEKAMRDAAELGLERTDEYVRLGCTVLSAYHGRGDIVRSRTLASDLVRAADEMGAPHTRGAAYWNASVIAESRGDLAQALSLVDRALALFGEGDDRRNLARLRMAYAWLLLQGEDPRPTDALDLLESVRGEVSMHGGVDDVRHYESTRADALLALGRLDEAHEAAVEALRDLGDQPRMESARARLVLARVLRAEGDVDQSAREGALAASMLEAMGASRRAAAAWRELGDLYRDLGRTDEALQAFDRALHSMHITHSVGAGVVLDAPAAQERELAIS